MHQFKSNPDFDPTNCDLCLLDLTANKAYSSVVDTPAAPFTISIDWRDNNFNINTNNNDGIIMEKPQIQLTTWGVVEPQLS